MSSADLIAALQHAPRISVVVAVSLLLLGVAAFITAKVIALHAQTTRMMIGAALLGVIGVTSAVGAAWAPNGSINAHDTYTTQAIATYVHDTYHLTALQPAQLDEKAAGSPSTATFDALRPDGTRVHVTVTWTNSGTPTPILPGATLPTATAPVDVIIRP